MARFSISGVPIVENGGRLVGIVTNRDLQFETDLSQTIASVMTSEELVTVPVGTTLDEAQAILHRHRIEKLPVVDDDGHLKGLITVKDIFKRRQYPNACKDEHGQAARGRRGRCLQGGRDERPSAWSTPAWTCSWSTPRTATRRACWRPWRACGSASPTSSSSVATSAPSRALGRWWSGAWMP